MSTELTKVDHEIEEKGFNFAPLAPVTRMFVFAKENLSGTEALHLASQMNKVYEDLARRGKKLGQYYTSK